MNRGIYIAASGMVAEQTALDAVANNLANANTAGFKSDGVVFGDALSQAITRQAQGGGTIGRLGAGPSAARVFTDFSTGPVQRTGRALDAALLSAGFFAVQTPQGTRYTRDGGFHVANGVLSTADGAAVLGQSGKPISVGDAVVGLSKDGTVTADGKPVDRLMIVQSADLRKVGENRFEGKATPAQQFELEPGALEGANLSVVTAMVGMIEIMRSYEASQKVVTTQDEALGRAVNDIARMG